MPSHLARCIVVAGVFTGAPIESNLQAQVSASMAGAKELVQLLTEKRLDSIAATHPAGQDVFVAALYFPGQLLVVWARYAAPTLLAEKIAKREYRDVYIDLNSASMFETKVLISDLGADGLKPRRDDNQLFDQQDAGGKGIRFDGEWREQKMSEQDYMKIYNQADKAYTQALDALIAQLKKGS